MQYEVNDTPELLPEVTATPKKDMKFKTAVLQTTGLDATVSAAMDEHVDGRAVVKFGTERATGDDLSFDRKHHQIVRADDAREIAAFFMDLADRMEAAE
ncbi:hypothetical protein [Pyruvatibacter mobilis]|uniref:hypothetical protein n=1 Tax=Pyruvatibacter mobilis TaxID=1712261 RepID=UPI003BAAE039